jgi:hypothetical protein
MKLIHIIYLLLISTFCKYSLASDNLTQTIACDTCGYNDAIVIAKEFHEQPNCESSNPNGGAPTLEETYYCPATSKVLIVANPLTRTSYKFEVSTQQQFDWAPAYDINVQDLVLTEDESNALHMFYDIDEDFRQSMEQNGPNAFAPAGLSSNSLISSKQPVFNQSSNASDEVDCSQHPSNVFSRGNSYLKQIQKKFSERITASMGLRSWSDFTSQQQITGGLSIGTSDAGININFSKIEREYFVTQRWDNGDKLVFKVDYHGETRDIVRQRRMSTVTDRFLNLSYKLMPGSSRIDGLSLNQIVRTHVDLTDTAISVCLSNKLSELLDNITVVGGAGGDGDLIDSVGADASVGGSLIPPAGTWVNLSGCQIVEGTGNICRSGTDDCMQVRYRYIDC